MKFISALIMLVTSVYADDFEKFQVYILDRSAPPCWGNVIYTHLVLTSHACVKNSSAATLTVHSKYKSDLLTVTQVIKSKDYGLMNLAILILEESFEDYIKPEHFDYDGANSWSCVVNWNVPSAPDDHSFILGNINNAGRMSLTFSEASKCTPFMKFAHFVGIGAACNGKFTGVLYSIELKDPSNCRTPVATFIRLSNSNKDFINTQIAAFMHRVPDKVESRTSLLAKPELDDECNIDISQFDTNDCYLPDCFC